MPFDTKNLIRINLVKNSSYTQEGNWIRNSTDLRKSGTNKQKRRQILDLINSLHYALLTNLSNNAEHFNKLTVFEK